MLDISANGTVHGPFKRGVSIPYNAMVLLDLIHIDFQNWIFWVLVFWCWIQGSRCLMWGSIPSLLEGKLYIFGVSLDCRSLLLGYHPGWDCISVSPTCFHVPLILCCRHTVRLLFRSFSEENHSICSCIFVVSMGAAEFKPKIFYFIYIYLFSEFMI